MSEVTFLPKPEIPRWLLEVARIPNGPFPLEAMREVWNRGDEIEGVLLEYVRWLADERGPGYTECDDDGWLHFIGFYLLADRGCRGLFEPLVEIARDEDYAEFVMGDSMTEDLPGWLMTIGTPADLRAVIEDEGANEWLCVAALGAVGAMAWDGRISREEHHDYIREFGERRERTDHPIWMEWLSQVGLFDWADLLDLVAELQRAGVFYGSEGVETTRKLMNEPGRDDWAKHAFFGYQPGGFAGLERLAGFPCFQPGYVEEDAEDEIEEELDFIDPDTSEAAVPYVPFGTIAREEPKIGRNDPCPCGSGKKWKKCCGK